MEYDFLIDTYATERIKTLSVWSMFKDEDMLVRPKALEQKNRNLIEHMVHQCLGENKWFAGMLGIDVGVHSLPGQETRLEFIRRYAGDSEKRLNILKEKDKNWWEQEVAFFDTKRPKTWIMTRRIAHTAHHRGEQTALLRMLKREVYSIYGPTADTGGLPLNNAKIIYAYPDIESLVKGEERGGEKARLPEYDNKPCTERP